MKKFFWEFVFSSMSLGSFLVIIAPDAPKVLYWLGWTYIVLLLGVAFFALNAGKISAWCDKKLAEKDDE